MHTCLTKCGESAPSTVTDLLKMGPCPNLPIILVHEIWWPQLVYQGYFCMGPAFQSCPQYWCSTPGSRVMAVQSFLHFWPVKHCHCLGWCLPGKRFKIPNLLNIVTAGPNARLEGVGSSGRARGLLQKPALPPWGHLRWFQARGAAEKAAKLWGAITVDPEGLKTLLLALVGIWLCGAGRQLNLVHFRATCNKFVYYWQRFPTTTRVPKNESILSHFEVFLSTSLFIVDQCMLWRRSDLTKVCFDEGPPQLHSWKNSTIYELDS